MVRSKLVTITGATGFLGVHLCRIMSELGWKVRAVDHSGHYTSHLKGIDVEVVRANVLDLDSLNKIFKKSDVVVHTASLISLTGDKNGKVSKININGAANVARAVATCEIPRLVHVSSIHAIDHDHSTPHVDETLPRAETSPIAYNRTKSLGEKAVREYIGNTSELVIVNPTGIIGPYDYRPSHMGVVLKRMYLGTLPMVPKAGFNWVDVRDVCQGIVAAIKKGKSGENYLLSGEYYSLSKIAQFVTKAKGKQKKNTPNQFERFILPAPFFEKF